MVDEFHLTSIELSHDPPPPPPNHIRMEGWGGKWWERRRKNEKRWRGKEIVKKGKNSRK